jgi:hypothetical protein
MGTDSPLLYPHQTSRRCNRAVAAASLNPAALLDGDGLVRGTMQRRVLELVLRHGSPGQVFKYHIGLVPQFTAG